MKRYLIPVLGTILLAAAPVFAKEDATEKDFSAPPVQDIGVYSHFLNAMLLERYGEFEKALKEYNRTLKIEPSASVIYRQRANLYLKMGNPSKALEDAQAYVRANPKDVEALLLLANIHGLMGQKNAAQLVLEKLLQENPEQEEALLTLATFLMNESPLQAITYLERLIKLNSGATEAYYSLGLIYQRLNQEDKSRKMFEKVIQLDSESVPSLVLLGQMKESAGSMPEALEYYERALQKMPENLALRIQLVLINAQKSDFAKIEELLEVFKDNPDAPLEAKLWLGIVHENRKEWAKALQYYEQAQRENQSTELLVRIASIYSNLGDGRNAVKTLETLTKGSPDNAQFQYFLGLARMDLRNYSKAVKVFRRAIELKPDFSSAHFQLGVALDSQKKWEEAEPCFKEAIRLDRENASALNYLGYSLVDRNTRLDEARKYIERALEIDYENPAYLDSLGWLNYREGRYEAALRQLNQAAQKMNDSIIFEHLAACHLATGNESLAAQNYQRSLALDPDNKEVKRKLKKLYEKMVSGAPAKTLLEQFSRNLDKASYISGALMLRAKGNVFAMGSAETRRGFFYVRKFDLTKSSAPLVPTDLRVDLLNPYSMPFIVLRYHYGKNSTWSVFPPEVKDELPVQTRWILETVASFLNGELLKRFHDETTKVEERRKSYHLSRTGWTLDLHKQGWISAVAGDDFDIEVTKYQKVDEIWLPEKMLIRWKGTDVKSKGSAQQIELEFPKLSLEKIENKIFEIGKEK